MPDTNSKIVELRAAMRRGRARMAAIESRYEFPRDCCPMCACGPEWNELADKLERQTWWLAQLNRKRGDLRRADQLEQECYKGQAPWPYAKGSKPR